MRQTGYLPRPPTSIYPAEMLHIVIYFKFHENRLSGVGAVGVENRPLLTRRMAYTTSCATVQAVPWSRKFCWKSKVEMTASVLSHGMDILSRRPHIFVLCSSLCIIWYAESLFAYRSCLLLPQRRMLQKLCTTLTIIFGTLMLLTVSWHSIELLDWLINDFLGRIKNCVVPLYMIFVCWQDHGQASANHAVLTRCRSL